MSTPGHLAVLDYSKSNELHSVQRENLLRILEEEKFTDLKFVVGPDQTIIKANRAFLASVSATFEKLLYPEDESKQPLEIDLPDISPQAFQSVLNFAYCNNPNLTADNVLSLKFLCERFEITSLSQICSDFWTQTLTPNNLCTLLHQSVIINSIEFIQQCQGCLSKFAKHADIMLNSSGFMQMNLRSMIVFLQTDDLKCEEHLLWQAILKWAEYQCDSNQPGEAIMNPLQSQASFAKLTDAEIMAAETGQNNEEYKEQVDTPKDGDNHTKPQHHKSYSRSKSKGGKFLKKEVSYTTPMGDEPLDKMDEEDFDKYLQIKVDHVNEMDDDEEEPLYVDINVAKNAPWKLKIKQPRDRAALLNYVKPYIRWGAMDAKYFIKKVKPEGIFTADELVTILTYFHCPDEGCGLFETKRRYELKGLTIQRGHIELAKWTYPGGKRFDAISFETASDAYLHAVGVFNCAGKCTAKVKVYRGDNGKENSMNVIGESEESIFEAIGNPSATPMQLKLDRPIKIEAKQRYTVELWQNNRNQAVSYQIKDGQAKISEEDFEVTFSRAAVCKNGTSVSKGAVPTLYFEF